MRETEEKRGWAENKLVPANELGRVHDEEDPRGAKHLAFLDYVMGNFGLP